MTPILRIEDRTIALSKVKVPLPIVLGKYEYLTDEELNEHIDDLKAEQSRRAASLRDS